MKIVWRLEFKESGYMVDGQWHSALTVHIINSKNDMEDFVICANDILTLEKKLEEIRS